METHRCFDCFAELPADARKFAVLKQMRDIEIPENASEPKSFFWSMAHDPVCVCADCAGWYGDQALEIHE